MFKKNLFFPSNVVLKYGCSIVVIVLSLIRFSSYAGTSYYAWQQRLNKGLKVGDPISASSGAYSFSIPFFNLGGPIPVRYKINYRETKFFLYDCPRLDPSSTGGYVYDYNQSADWLYFSSSHSPQGFSLKHTTNYSYFVSYEQNLIYIFKKYSDATGDYTRLLYIMDRNGNKLTYTFPETQRWGEHPLKIEDGLGRELNFTYTDNYTVLTKVTDQTGRTISFAYNVDNKLTTVTDPLGNTITFTYDEGGWEGVVSAVTYQNGNTPVTNTYQKASHTSGYDVWVTSQTDAYGNKLTLSYSDEPDRKPVDVTATFPDSSTAKYTHYYSSYTTNDAEGIPESYTDASGKTISFGKDDNVQNITSVTDRIGDTVSMTYHSATGKLTSITDAEGNKTTYTYTEQTQTITNPDNSEKVELTFYNLTKVEYPDGTTEEYSYDSYGNVSQYTDRAGKVWKYEYNSMGLVTSVTNPEGGVTTYTYNTDGTLASMKDSDTGTTTYTYDSAKRLVKITFPDSTTQTMTYNDMDNMSSMTDRNGNTYTYTFDANGNVTSVTDPAGNKTTYTYDLMDRVSSITDKLGKKTTYTYDSMGRLSTVKDPDGITYTYTYDSRGRRTGVTKGTKTWSTAYDDEDVPSSKTTPSGAKTSYSTNKCGFVTKVTSPNGEETSFELDKMNRVSSVTDPAGKTTSFSYDSNGNISAVTLPDKGKVEYSYDSFGNITKITDFNGNEWKFEYTSMGRKKSFTDPEGRKTSYTLDTLGRISKITYPDNTTCEYTYNNTGMPTEIKYSDITLQYTYDSLNRITAADGITLEYDAEGHVTNTQDGNVKFTAQYTDGGKLKSVTYNNGAFTVTYTYDSEGLLTSVSDNLTSTTVQFSWDTDEHLSAVTRPSGINSSFSYDKNGRITKIKHGSIIELSYSYDSSGNISSSEETTPISTADYLTAEIKSFSYDKACQIDSDDYSYDKRGRLTSDGSTDFTWDGASRITKIGSATLTYNSLHQLRTRTESGTGIHYYYNHAIALAPVVAEQDESSGAFLRYYVWTPEGRLLYMIDASNGNKVYFYHTDIHGSVLAITDANGSVTDSYAYTPYGKLLKHQGSLSQPFTFLGEYGIRMESASLYQIRRRYYDANSARFLSPDPIWPEGTAFDANPYQYAMMNPMLNIDITGKEGKKAGKFKSNAKDWGVRKTLAAMYVIKMFMRAQRIIENEIIKNKRRIKNLISRRTAPQKALKQYTIVKDSDIVRREARVLRLFRKQKDLQRLYKKLLAIANDMIEKIFESSPGNSPLGGGMGIMAMGP